MTDEQTHPRIHRRRSRDTRLMLIGEERERDFASGHDVHKYSTDTSAELQRYMCSFFCRPSTSQSHEEPSS